MTAVSKTYYPNNIDLSEIKQRLAVLHRQREEMFGKNIISSWLPLSDIWENDEIYLISIELPGTEFSEISTDVRNNILIVSGKKSPYPEIRKLTTVRRESSHGPFQRTFKLPAGVQNYTYNHWFQDGILTICFEKQSIDP